MIVGLLKLVGLVEELPVMELYQRRLEDGNAEVQVYNVTTGELGPKVRLGVFDQDFERKYLK